MEVLADALKGLPNMIASRLMQLKNMDRFSKETLNSLIEEENKFLDDLKSVPKDADESQLLNKLQSLFDKRHEVVTMLDNQMKNIQRTYDQIDKKIAYLDHSTKNINYLFPFNGDEVGGSDQRKKKKRKVSNLDDGGQEQIPIVDSNEPLYCTCRQVSYGQMIACDNPDCQVEWFHFSCVGLLIEPTQWTCSECMGAGSSEVDKSEGLLDFDN